MKLLPFQFAGFASFQFLLVEYHRITEYPEIPGKFTKSSKSVQCGELKFPQDYALAGSLMIVKSKLGKELQKWNMRPHQEGTDTAWKLTDIVKGPLKSRIT